MMTDIKLEASGAIAGRATTADVWLDWAARATVVAVFSLYAYANLRGLPGHFPLDNIHKALALAAAVANIMFVSLVASTALTRLAPVRKAKGIEPRATALLGTFLCIWLAALPRVDLGPVLSALSIVLTIAGVSLSFVVLRWLGRSFSIMAEARRLVTAGPYRYVRHPLYLCEGIATLGALMRVISPWAILIAVAFAALQYRRMLNEERVLEAAFPEYRDYAAQTPRVIPKI
jgi:protein-S-isoprenylcysteine O-methyltransferase Ste14